MRNLRCGCIRSRSHFPETYGFMWCIQMVPVANEPPAACLLGACATNHNESARVPAFTMDEKADAKSLATRLVALARATRGMRGREAHNL